MPLAIHTNVMNHLKNSPSYPYQKEQNHISLDLWEHKALRFCVSSIAAFQSVLLRLKSPSFLATQRIGLHQAAQELRESSMEVLGRQG